MSVQNIIDVISKIKTQDKKIALGFATTSTDQRPVYFSFPKKIRGYGYYIHIVVTNDEDWGEVFKLRNLADDVFIDCENKGRNLNPALALAKKQDIKYKLIYPNFLTVLEILQRVNDFSPKHILVRGRGFLADILCSELSRTNLDWFYDDFKQPDNLKFSTYPRWEKKRAEFEGLLINLAPNISSYLADGKIQPKDVIDVSSDTNHRYKENVNVKFIDTSTAQANYVENILVSYDQQVGRKRQENGDIYVSGGTPGRSGEYIVDNCNTPRFQLGRIDSNGALIRAYRILDLD